VWVHGGAWVGSNRLALAGAAGYVPELARRLGAAIVSVDFRQSPDPPFGGTSGAAGAPSGAGTASVAAHRSGFHATSSVPLTTMVSDVTAALAFVREQAPAWGLDPSRFVLMGDSSGAHVAALTAYAGRSFSESGPQPGWSGGGAGSVRALVSLVGPTDLQLLAGAGVDVLGVPLARYVTAALGCEPAVCPAERWRAADPTAWIGPASPPTWIVVGDGDTLVPTVHGERWYESLVSRRGTDETDAIDVVDTGDASWRTHNGVELGLNLTFLELWLRERLR
jgi:acetyl esterase/lipase